MKYLKFLPVILVLIFLLYYYFGIYDGGKQQLQSNQQIESISSVKEKKWETKTDEKFPVTIKVTPIELGGNAEIWKFEVVFDTHSGSLDEDPIKITVLTDDKGNSYPALLWTGPIGGHHISGTLTFPKISQGAKSMKLIMKNLYNEPERIFIWELG